MNKYKLRWWGEGGGYAKAKSDWGLSGVMPKFADPDLYTTRDLTWGRGVG